ncbi:MAG TPA: hypothetical protein VIT62_06475 [Lysobacter sp.]
MKTVSAKATFSSKAKDLFGSRDSARETFKKVIEARSETATGTFTVRGVTLRTERAKRK